jgi:hypothetical protein
MIRVETRRLVQKLNYGRAIMEAIRKPCAAQKQTASLRKDLGLLLVLGSQCLLEPRDARLGTTQDPCSCGFERFRHLRRTWKTPCSFLIKPIPKRIVDPTA